MPFPHRLQKARREEQFSKFLDIFKKIEINIPFVKVINQMPIYAKFLKEILSKKMKIAEEGIVNLTATCSAVIQKKLPAKMKDGSFTIPCSIGKHEFKKALCDSSANINLMPLSVVQRLNLGELTPTAITLQTITLEHPDVDAESCKAVGNNSLLNVELNYDCILQHSINEIEVNFQYLESLDCEVLPSNLFNKETVSSINENSQDEVCSQKQQTYEQETSAEGLTLKALPSHLKYEFLEPKKRKSVIISAALTKAEEQKLLEILRKYKEAIAWSIEDLKRYQPLHLHAQNIAE